MPIYFVDTDGDANKLKQHFGLNELETFLSGLVAIGREKQGIRNAGEPPTPKTLNDYAREVHEANQKWWRHIDTGEPLERNKGELLMLIVSEISEAMEGERKDLMDDKLPHRKMAEVELADALIRIMDYAAAYGYDLDGAYREKMAYNATREDHKHEARKLPGGKRF